MSSPGSYYAVETLHVEWGSLSGREEWRASFITTDEKAASTAFKRMAEHSNVRLVRTETTVLVSVVSHPLA
jgi:hypothetical protein